MTTLTAKIHREGGSYWADIPELPGVFATGDTLDELFESLREGVGLVLTGSAKPEEIQLEGAVISVS
ncbi:MAG: type II toxin-antitoxin system HicB family antitoxin [Solirubrobacterales bacterium]